MSTSYETDSMSSPNSAVSSSQPRDQTQATNLPRHLITDIYANAPELTKPEQFGWWLANIKRILGEFDLEGLVSDLPCPSPHDPARLQWFRLSKLVCVWLDNQVNSKYLDKIYTKNRHIIFAHEFISAARTVMREIREWQVQNAHFAFYNLKRSECGSIQEFVETAKERFHKAWELQAGVPPWAAVSLVARGVSSLPDTKCFYSFVKDTSDDDDLAGRENFTAADFYAFCDYLLRCLADKSGAKHPLVNVFAFTVPRERLWS
ncbi:hypothetical protein N7475_001126 [Penicillium sp. IBT 31633x]|nr:hypothetical protein N7475_001126 [Penicillium sp. IBT 31633x]